MGGLLRGGKQKLVGGWGRVWSIRKEFPNFSTNTQIIIKALLQTADRKLIYKN